MTISTDRELHDATMLHTKIRLLRIQHLALAQELATANREWDKVDLNLRETVERQLPIFREGT